MRKLKPMTPGDLLLEEFLKPLGISRYRCSFAVSAGIPNSASNPFSCLGIFTSSSHMGRIQQFGSDFQDFRNGFTGERAVALLDFLDGHPLRKASENQRCRQTSAPNRRFASK